MKSHDKVLSSPGQQWVALAENAPYTPSSCVCRPQTESIWRNRPTSGLQIERNSQESGGWKDRPSALYSKAP